MSIKKWILILLAVASCVFVFTTFNNRLWNDPPVATGPVVPSPHPTIIAKEVFATNTLVEAGKSPWEIALIFVVMIVGMFCNQAFEMITSRQHAGKATVNVKKIFSESLRGTKFWTAVLVSPMVLYITYNMIYDMNKLVVILLFSFQNGFFWYYIFCSLQKKYDTASTGEPVPAVK